MNPADAKKRLLFLIERYGSARCQEALAGQRDAMAAVERYHVAGEKAWNEICEELSRDVASHPPANTDDNRMSVATSIRRLVKLVKLTTGSTRDCPV